MLRRNLALIVSIFTITTFAKAEDFGIHMPDDPNIKSVYENAEADKPGEEPYLQGHAVKDYFEEEVATPAENILETRKLSDKKVKALELEDFGYNALGTVPESTSYENIDKKYMVQDFRILSKAALNLSFINNGYDYTSKNDIINQTLDTGFHSGKGGYLLVRNDSYITKARFLNTHWSLGTGIGFSTGKGVFIDGTRSDATINFWEVPLELGLGIEIPISSWFKLVGTGGGGALGVVQSRSDYKKGDKGKRKYQVSPGYFGSAQFKINLTGFSTNWAYDIFTSSDITNIFLNLELRHQSYENFKDDISIAGTSIGAGFTFEYL